MQSDSTEAVTYQYPDPDELDQGSRFAWAPDDNDYVPVALRPSLANDWEVPEAEDGNDFSFLAEADSGYAYGPFSPQEDEIAADDNITADYGESEAEVAVDRGTRRPSPITLKSPRRAKETSGSRQESARQSSGPWSRQSQRGGLGRGKPGIKRGLRDPVEPEPEFKLLLSKATMAFIAHDYNEAESLTLQALQINPEMYPAHSLLSQIHAARGDLDKAIAVAYNGAHTRPRDTEMWSRIARMLLDRDQEHTITTLRDAVYCYNRIISIDKYNVEARYQRAALNHELGKVKQVVSEYEQLNKYLPHDTSVLRHLAQVSIEVNEPGRALRHYKEAIAYYQELEPLAPTSFTWSDINVLVELHILCREYEQGLELTKSLSRWLLGRRNDRCWDNFTEDDREWDLEDQPRRIDIPGFIPNQYEARCYGAGLPLDLRIKMGIFRLHLKGEHIDEALWLEPADGEIGAKVFDYPDLFRDVARSLMDKGLYQDAIRYFEPLQQVVDHVDDSYRAELAQCYFAIGRKIEGEALQSNIQDYDEDGEDKDYEESESSAMEHDITQDIILAPSSSVKRTKKPVEKGITNTNSLRDSFDKRQSLKESLQPEEGHIKSEWKYHPSTDHTRQGRFLVKRRVWGNASVTNSKLESDLRNDAVAITEGFGGISFNDWLEVLLEYGLYLAYEGHPDQAYQVLGSAMQANVFYNMPDSLFLIHVCWFTCALLSDDDETLCSICRWFMKEFQFVPDSYRLFSALNRLCDGDYSWFHSGPSQKHILRQVKAMDFSLAGPARGKNSYQERSAFTAKDSEGNVVLPRNMDVSLLMLYGHVLYVGKSYAYANNYFLRALSVDPENPVIKLSLALGYIHHSLKRQADNRHKLLLQGFSFLFEYYYHRQEEGGPSEKQEAAYNVARAFHMLGLTHVAIPYYEHCLELSKSVRGIYTGAAIEDFAEEAAFALQGIWATNGNAEKALHVTKEWLSL